MTAESPRSRVEIQFLHVVHDVYRGTLYFHCSPLRQALLRAIRLVDIAANGGEGRNRGQSMQDRGTTHIPRE